MDRPVTTLFMLMSVDGKISTGADDALDADRDFPMIDGLKEGLHQYYEVEQRTDPWSFNTGRVQEKMGVNRMDPPAGSLTGLGRTCSGWSLRKRTRTAVSGSSSGEGRAP